MTRHSDTPARHARDRRQRRIGPVLLIAVALMACVIGLLAILSTERSRHDELSREALSLQFAQCMDNAAAALDSGDADPETADLHYLSARASIARADSLTAAGAPDTVPADLRRRADLSLTAVSGALQARLQLFSDMPGYAADLARRTDSVRRAIDRYHSDN